MHGSGAHDVIIDLWGIGGYVDAVNFYLLSEINTLWLSGIVAAGFERGDDTESAAGKQVGQGETDR